MITDLCPGIKKGSPEAIYFESLCGIDRDRILSFLGSSPFACSVISRDPEILFLFDKKRQPKPYTPDSIRADYEKSLLSAKGDYEALFQLIRKIKNRELISIAIDDFFERVEVSETLRRISTLADFCIDCSVRAVVPEEPQNNELSLKDLEENCIIVAMGKHGGMELNISSDIDLIFFSSDSFLGDHERAMQLNRILTRLIYFLESPSSEGFLYRIDMRLRPEGSSGPLIMGIKAAEEYYNNRARQWELQAMIKHRKVWGNEELALDFSTAIEKIIYAHEKPERIVHDIRRIKEDIEKRLNEDESKPDIKLSPGGIRDIEFIIQFLQLIHGARYSELRKGNSLEALKAFNTFHIITDEEYSLLKQNYLILRKIENILQLRNNLQVRELPLDHKHIQEVFSPWFHKSSIDPDAENPDYFIQLIVKTLHEVRHIFSRLFDETIHYLSLKKSIKEKCADLPGEYIDHHFRRMDSEYFLFFTEEAICQHLHMIQRLDYNNLTEIDVRRSEKGRWHLTIIAFDYDYEFSKIAGLISAYYLKIIEGESFTYVNHSPLTDESPEYFYRRPRKQLHRGRFSHEDLTKALLKRRKIVCYCTVAVMDNLPEELGTTDKYTPSWNNFKSDLSEVLNLLENNKERESSSLLNARLMSIIPKSPTFASSAFAPIDIVVDNESSFDYTILQIRSRDSFGFLYTFTNVLAMRNYYIFKIEIETIHDMAQDRIFILTRDGKKITDRNKIDELKIAVTLIKQYTSILSHAVNPHKALEYFDDLLTRVLESGEEQTIPILGQRDVQETLAKIFGISDFLWEDLIRFHYQTLLPQIGDQRIERKIDRYELSKRCHSACSEDLSDEEFLRALNNFKDQEMFRIDVRQILKKIDFWTFANELTELAEVVITEAIKRAEKETLPQHKFPEKPEWALFSLGKLGGSELGYASDIELMFVYRLPTWYQEHPDIYNFFEAMLQRFIASIKSKRRGIFEIDMNLRPHGKSGSLAVSDKVFKEYFSPQGDALLFERQALIKLRFLTSSPEKSSLCDEILSHRDSFVYSSLPVDLHSVTDLREKQVRTYIEQPGSLNMKYSKGTLVEIEYITQLLQIVYGSKNPAVRCWATLDALSALKKEGFISMEIYHGLKEAYIFYRNIINILRMVHGNARDLAISPPGTLEYSYLVKRSHFVGIIDAPDSESLIKKIGEHRDFVSRIFSSLEEIIK